MPVDRAWLSGRVRDSFAPRPPARLGVAVSGGSDSTALLMLLNDWRRDGGPDLAAATVDHGLRPEAAAEASAVAVLCERLGVQHDVLQWRWDGRGNLPDAARRGRYGLIADWARGKGFGVVALGHTADDQAETFLMRLARGSGVDGLSGMAARRTAEGIEWVRPVLGLRREDLRDVLRDRGVGWADDPTNEDETYDRVKARKALGVLAGLGIGVEGLVHTAHWMGLARSVLDDAAQTLARAAARIEAGDVVIARRAFHLAPVETRYRLLAHALRWVVTAPYRGRENALTEALVAIGQRKTMTLAGCVISGTAADIRVAREYNAVRDLSSASDQVWDNRWRLTGPHRPGLAVRALGEAGLRQCKDRRATGLPRRSLLSSPAVWEGERLLAAPLADRDPASGPETTGKWVAELIHGPEHFFTTLIVH